MSPQRSVLVTGCSAGGIGSSMALAFAKRGLTVFATARNPSKVDPALSSLSNVEVVQLDTTSIQSITAAAQTVAEKTGGTLDYLVNNAGTGLVSPFLDTDLQKARDLFEVNFWGVLQCILGFKSLLVEGKGTIVNVSSIAGELPNPYESIYNSSKAAITHFSRVLALELAPLDVKVVTLATGMVQSTWYENSVPQLELPKDSYYLQAKEAIQEGLQGKDNKERGTPVVEYAESVVRQVLNGKTGKVYGASLSTLAWFLGFLPGWITDRAMIQRGQLDKLAATRKSA